MKQNNATRSTLSLNGYFSVSGEEQNNPDPAVTTSSIIESFQLVDNRTTTTTTPEASSQLRSHPGSILTRPPRIPFFFAQEISFPNKMTQKYL